MSKRHQAHRRRAYGRRQHELHERRMREETWQGLFIQVVDVEDPDVLDAFDTVRRARRHAFGFSAPAARWLAEAG